MEEKLAKTFKQGELDKITDKVLAYRPKKEKTKDEPPDRKLVAEQERGPV